MSPPAKMARKGSYRKYLCFTAHEDDKLIDFVRQNTALFNPRAPEYKDMRLKEEMWREFAGKIGRSVEECKLRWKHLRDNYQRKARVNATSKTYSQRNDNKFKMMTFIESTLQLKEPSEARDVSAEERDSEAEAKEKLTHCHNIISPEMLVKVEYSQSQIDESSNKAPSETATTSHNRRLRAFQIEQSRKKRILEKKKQMIKKIREERVCECKKEKDSLDLFYETMKLTTRAFPTEFITETKIKVFQVVTEMETRMNKELPRFHYEDYSALSTGTSSRDTMEAEARKDLHS